MVKVGPGENNLFKIIEYGEHSEFLKERPKHYIASILLARIDAAANSNTTPTKIRTSIEIQQLNNRLANLKIGMGSRKWNSLKTLMLLFNQNQLLLAVKNILIWKEMNRYVSAPMSSNLSTIKENLFLCWFYTNL